LGISVFAIAFIGTTSGAYAASTYTLDPVLSLTGSCTTTERDPVKDPGCPGGEHPPKPFKSPRGVTTDFYGDIYVVSFGNESENGKGGRIDVFDPEGFFITELLEPAGPKDVAVDSKGNLYVSRADGKIMRYEPSSYDPEAGKIAYGKAPVLVAELTGAFLNSLAISASNDHLFVKRNSLINEYSSAEKGNELLSEIGSGALTGNLNGQGLAVDEAHGRIYAADNGKVRVLNFAPPHELLMTIEGSSLPGGGGLTSLTSVAADEATGNFFIFDGTSSKGLFEFNEKGEFVTTIEDEFPPIAGSEVAVDNGPFSPNSGFNSPEEAGYVFATSEEGVGINFAFEPPISVCLPEVEAVSFANVSQEDAELQATINPCRGETHYTFEYTTQENFEAEGFEGAAIAGEGEIPAGKFGVEVAAPATGLAPETVYVFRVVAENEAGEAEAEGSFGTYASETIKPCPNDSTRTGLSALLPDCRAYELVTPPDTNARTPRGISTFAGFYFTTREASPAGDKVSFTTEGGAIPGYEGTGSLLGDPYLATRGPNGWSTASAGPNGVESLTPLIGSTSPDQGYSFWGSNGEEGSASIEGKNTNYLRYPDGHSEIIGRGSIGTDLAAQGELISENGSHVVFVSINDPKRGHPAVQLEPNAPPEGTQAIYDRTIDGTTGEEETHVISLLPGNVTPSAGQDALYTGASLDGKGVAFTIGKKLYLRYDNQETYEIGEGAVFAGVAEGGARIFYVKGGDLFAFDAEAEETTRFTESGDVTPVNIAAEGTAAYFVSPSVLTGGEGNPNGDTAQPGEENLYLTREGAISFVGTVTKGDVEAGGLGAWTSAVGAVGGNAGRLGENPSRATPNGNALLFESRADLSGYDPEGHAEVYRYDFAGDSLACLSCNPTQAPATSDASLQSNLLAFGEDEPFSNYVLVGNLRADGRRAFFQSSEQLVARDTDGQQDVYEWEAEGVGSCERPQGCLYLISSGQSGRVNYLYAVSNSGDDVFFRSSDLLVPLDTDSTPSIYDARVGGGFPEEPETCQIGQDCGGTVTPGPSLGGPASEALGPPDNFVPPKKCPKGKHRVTKNGKTRCVKKHHKRKHHRAGSKRKAVGK
jgi:sugar lactone lactonase YvrE